ncbi:rRNA biogenesis protein RRP5 [Marchantia polymorpha subsp. ruderalis]|uniref:S1 motif domain-containing protein n=2 Tax=Marchantia polymorpha TaxID=3197 RepID=A0AAF6APH8_MARPO|nr:hypothetical protein MARPO_0019s0051 [Marchantia polymorpha]BBM98348.1 hypothetical protein Mp_1g12810 [Marchantia polymorpha subsp. ruderalis]|eukprot:PTQ44615.1 hypothetical protein MARPO_0019s0051 [Marchantia polymorpha]
MGKRTIEESPGTERTSKKHATSSDFPSKEKSSAKAIKGDKPSTHTGKPVYFDANQDEADFPRGGASALTPAELREIRSQAEAEFDSEIGKSTRKVKQGKRKSKTENAEDEDEGSLFGAGITGTVLKSAEILRHKILCVGMKIWGAVAEVNNRDLVICLPGGLRGFVQAEEASDVIGEILKSGRVKKAELRRKSRMKEAGVQPNKESAEQSDEDASDGENDEFTLKGIFSVGQLVACTVKSLESVTSKKEKGKNNKRIGLSLRLSHLHEGISVDNMREGYAITACVSSIEDHGYLLSLGVTGLSGFLLHRSSVGQNDFKLKKGQLVTGVVASVDKKRGTVNLIVDQKAVAAAVVLEQEGFSVEQLIPGSLVNAKVRAVLRDGLLVSFLTYMNGTVNMFHLDVPLVGPKWAETYAVNHKLKARILYVDPVTKMVGLTLNLDLVHNRVPSWAVKSGDIFNNALVRRVDATIGLLLELPSKPNSSAAYVHISNASDGHIDKLEKKFTEGKKVKARVTGFRIMDGLAIASLKTAVLEQLILSHADVKVGMLVHATVVAVESFGAIVQIGEGLKGLCPLQHMSEYQRSTPSPKFQVGAKLKFRVISIDSESKKVTLTHKKTLVSSKLTPITSFEDAVEGMVTYGWITGIEDYGCFVSFYNDVKGLVHRTEMGLPSGNNPTTAFQLGQVVKCRVMRSDPSSKRLSVSFSTTNRTDNDAEGIPEIQVGSIVSGTVSLVKDNSLMVDVMGPRGVTQGVLAYSQLSDISGHVEQFKALVKPGYKFDRLLVLELKERKLVLSAKFSLLEAASSLPSDVSQLQADSVLQGYIANVIPSGCFIRFLGRLTGLASLREASDVFIADPSKVFSAGQSVRAKVLQVMEEKGKFFVSLKQSLCFSTDASLLHGFLIEEEKIFELQSGSNGASNVEWSKELTIGSYVDGEIQDVKDYGVIVNIYKHKDIVGFLSKYQLGDPVEVGTKVRARILDVAKVDGIVDLTIRTELFSSDDSASIKKSNSKKRKSSYNVAPKQTVTAVVEVVKTEYLVLSLPDHGNLIGFASVHDYNVRLQDPHKDFRPGQRLTARIQHLPNESTGGRLLLLLDKSSKVAELASPKKQRMQSSFTEGALVVGEIQSIDPVNMILDLGKSVKGVIHVSEVWDEFMEGHPFSAYKVGKTITAKVLTTFKTPRTTDGLPETHLELSLRPSELSAEGVTTGSRPLFETMTVGQIVTAYVHKIEDDKAWLLVGPHLRGRLFILDYSTEPSELREFHARLKVGYAHRCWVLGKDLEKGTLDLSFREVSATGEVLSGKVTQSTVEKGNVLGGRVTKVYPGIGGLLVQIGSGTYGKVHVTHLSDVWLDNPAKKFQEGQFVKCVVLEVSTEADGKLRIALSLRASLGGLGSEDDDVGSETRQEDAAIVETLQDLSVGLRTQAYVKSASKKGCFVVLSRSVEGRILIKNLSDTFVADPAESFTPGMVVRGRIISVERLSGRVEMSLRTSQSTNSSKSVDDIQDEKRFESLNVGDIITCHIKKIASFGLFLAIESSQIVGLCHVSEVADNFLDSLTNHFHVGQKVRAKILKIDGGKKRVSFGMKESYFSSEKVRYGGEEDSEAAVDDEDYEVDADLDGLNNGRDEDDDSDESLGKENDDLEVLAAVTKKNFQSKLSEVVPALEVDLDPESGDENEGGIEKGEEDRTEDENEGTEKQKKRAKNRLKKEREAAIAAAEEKRLKDNETPETVDEFEQLVRASPNSSFVWIKYMAFMLSIADVERARAVAERALQTINFREESEKMNVWVAYLNLENAYGNPRKEAVLKVFQKAVQYCDPKKLYVALLGIYERTEQEDMADELLKTMVRKFKTSAKIWLRFIQRALKKGAANKALDQSLLSLPKRKHLKVITQVSIMEFKHGSPERGRAIFEGIVRNYPKRLDLWSVYLDQEIRVGDVDIVRALFERAVLLELQPKKMKTLFKRYLDFEKTHGDEARVEYVKTKAMEYVENKLG